MSFRAGNRAIRDHVREGKDLLLFEKVRLRGVRRHRFLGTFTCVSWEWRRSYDRQGALRGAIVFHLLPQELYGSGPVENADNPDDDEGLAGASLDDLRDRAYRAATSAAESTPARTARSLYRRSRVLAQYVLKRADGRCERCGQSAPFVRKDGMPYLEPHHIRRLSDGGPDHPRWVAAICPNCHREIHHGPDGDAINDALSEYLGRTEGR